MNNRFFFISTYDNISGKILSSLINTHPDISCKASYPDPFLPIPFTSKIEPAKLSLDKFIKISQHKKIKFSGNVQRYSAFELQHKKLIEKTIKPYNTANILISPELRVNFILQSWMTSDLDVVHVLDNIEKKAQLLQAQNNYLYSHYIFHSFYNQIRDVVQIEKIADLTLAKNKIFIYALAKMIAYDTADLPTPAKKFRFESLIESPDEFITFLSYLTNSQLLISDEFRQQLPLKLNEQNETINNMQFPKWSEWQTSLLNRFINLKLETIYSPHFNKSLFTQYAEAGYFSTKYNTGEKRPYSKLISIQLNSNRPAQLAAYFDNLEETTDNPDDIEVLVNIDKNDSPMLSLLQNEMITRPFQIKYVETEKPKSFCDLWKPINKLLKITDPNSYFLVNISDEMLFVTKGWDTILKKYVGFFPDHLFRLRASRNKFRNYFDRWECSFAQDAIPITTKKWVDTGGDWNPCFGPDSFQQLVSLYLSKEGMFSNSNYLRDVPLTEITFSGDVPALGIDPLKAWKHHKDHIVAMQICQSYPMQLEARRRAILIKANIIAEAAQINHFKINDDKAKKQISLYDCDKNMMVGIYDYRLSWLAITFTNQWRKLAFFHYFGDGPTKGNPIRSYLRYLKARHFWFLKAYKLARQFKLFLPRNIKEIHKILQIKKKFSDYLISPIKQENSRLKKLYESAQHENDELKNYLKDKWMMPIRPKKRVISDNNSVIDVMTSPPKISIIVGVLNMASYLAAALDSVINQNYSNLELIVMDGGSTDGTLDIIKKYEKHISFWKSEKDKGHCDACNKALDIATGDFILLLNADDLIGENLLHKVAAVYSKNPDALVITCGVRIAERDTAKNERVILEITDPEKLQITLINMMFELPVINARFFHKQIFRKFGKFQAVNADGGYNLSNDRDFLIKLAIGGVQSEIIPEALYFYLSHNESLTFGKKNMVRSRQEHLKLSEKLLLDNTLMPEQKLLIKSWQLHESVYLFLIFIKRLNLRNSFSTLQYGLSQGGYHWFRKLNVIIVKSIIKKTKKLTLRKS